MIGAQRELFEETGIEMPEDCFSYSGKTVMEEYQCIMYTFLVCVEDDVKLNLQAAEVVDAKWVDYCELGKMKDEIVDSLWERYLQFKSKLTE